MVVEFYGPFAHLPGRLEWCRIHSPTHGTFDCCVVIDKTTADPVTVYVNDDVGEAFMEERFPESRTIRTLRPNVRLLASGDGRRLHCRLVADAGPLRHAEMAFQARPAVPRETPYGGEGKPVWGSRFSCEGVDLELDADVHGALIWEDRREPLAGVHGILTVGSMGRLEPLRSG